MGKGKWIAAVAVLAVLLCGIGWHVESPIYTLGEMRDAAKSNNLQKLSSYIDYPALRESLKAQIMARVQSDVAKKDQSGIGSFEVAMAAAVIGRLTDAVVSPVGVRAMLLSNQREELATSDAAHSPVQLDSDVVIERHGLSQFEVRSRSSNGGALVFKRHGLGWKLSGLELPPSV